MGLARYNCYRWGTLAHGEIFGRDIHHRRVPISSIQFGIHLLVAGVCNWHGEQRK